MSTQSIIDHLNHGHQHNLEDLLVVYGKLSKSELGSPKVAKIDLKSLTISYGSEPNRKSKKIEFLQSVKSYDDFEDVVLSMFEQAADKRGFSAYKITTIPLASKPLELAYWVAFMLLVFLAFAPGTTVDLLVNQFGLSLNRAVTFNQVARWIINTLCVTHSTETAMTLNPQLAAHRVPVPKRMVACFLCMIEGVFFIRRFEREVKKAEGTKMKVN
ncbi:hypothetical protein FOA43_003290 [Brettanomyces nanus]|uniref:DUF2470 domain-containing protein n=1 Tax=Eeniella nana TaxID=13502 RepID=A0A875SA80_EENNA|nr:uncharacterized protein FOA43_003290 [Brettanomyces nanus]QPG75904.1 hypothetical protein FOA43_003290 [Brettanomyces nanus]